MKKILRAYLAGAISMVLLIGGVAYAKVGSKTIEAVYKNIKIYVNGAKITPKDANGTTVEPFIYNGTTYLPVRAIGQALGKEITWDGSTCSVHINDKKTGESYMLDICPPYKTSKIRTGDFKMAGKNYRGLYSYNGGESVAYFNLDGKYKRMSLEIAYDDNYSYEKSESKVKFYLDGELEESYTVTAGMSPKKISINLDSALQLKIVVDDEYSSVRTGMGNIIVE